MANDVINEIQFGSKEEYEKAKAAFTSPDGDGNPYLDFEKIVPMPKDFEEVPSSSRVDDGIELVYAESDRKGKEDIVNLLKAALIPAFIVQDDLNELAYLDAHPEAAEELRENIRKAKDLTLEETLEFGRKAIKNLRNYRVRNWYDWRVNNWGTKGGPEECVFMDDDLAVSFITPWSCPLELLIELSKRGYRFSCRYADEDLGHNCGVFASSGDGSHTLMNQDFIKDPMGFAVHLWGYEDIYKKDENGDWVYVG